MKTAYVLFVMHLETRRIVLAEATFCPHSRWMAQMARNLLVDCEEADIQPRFILHDRDGLFVHSFDATLKGAGVEVVKTPFHAPNADSHAERWVLSARGECLDQLVLFGLENLRHAVEVYRRYHNELRPHQGLGQSIPPNMNRAPIPSMDEPPIEPSDAICTSFLYGLLKSYSRKAA